jgi:ABC-type polysaccharide/polyol phosphate export permease
MFREIGIILGVLVCIFFFVPGVMHPPSITAIGVIALVAFIGLIAYSGFYIRKLYSKNPTGAVVFSVILLAVILVFSAYIWWWSIPLRI